MSEPTLSSINYIFGRLTELVSEEYCKLKIVSIQRILEIDVKVFLCLIKSSNKREDNTPVLYSTHFEIHSKNSYYGLNDHDEDILYSSQMSYRNELDLDCVRRALTKIHETIPKLCIDINRSRFSLPIDEGFLNTYIGGYECSVCLEKTTTLSNCEHALCLVCWSNMQTRKNVFNCPLCREPVRYKLNKDYESD